MTIAIRDSQQRHHSCCGSNDFQMSDTESHVLWQNAARSGEARDFRSTIRKAVTGGVALVFPATNKKRIQVPSANEVRQAFSKHQ